MKVRKFTVVKRNKQIEAMSLYNVAKIVAKNDPKRFMFKFFIWYIFLVLE